MVKISPNNISPVVVGALGGSGTRVIADILMQAGVYLGRNLNDANDNLTFTCLFKRADWFINSSAEDKIATVQLFEKIIKEEKLSATDKLTYAKAYLTNWNYTIKNKVKAPFRKKKKATYSAWGWKEPNSHLILEELHQVYPGMRYIHVVRDGLDMAYSANIQQLKNWGKLYGIDLPQNKNELPKAQLDYWIKANETAINKAKDLFKDRFFLVKFEEMCEEPINTINNLIQFLGLNTESEVIKKLALLPKLPSSSGRYKTADLSIFTKGQLMAVSALGYPVEANIFNAIAK